MLLLLLLLIQESCFPGTVASPLPSSHSHEVTSPVAAVPPLICFAATSVAGRGVQISLYDYMFYTETLLGYRSLLLLPDRLRLLGHNSQQKSLLKKFSSRFGIVYYRSPSSEGLPSPDLAMAAMNQSCQMLYLQSSGILEDEPRFPGSFHYDLPLAIHATFQYQPYGTAYAAVAKHLLRRECYQSVPLIVSPPPNEQSKSLEYPFLTNNTLVICRHGGFETFNLNIAHDAVRRASRDFSPSELQFIFLNTRPFLPSSPSVHFLDSITDDEEKEIFFSTCDVMLHARIDGESFGLAVAEMSVRNKPIMTYLPSSYSLAYDTHIQYLGGKGYYYSDWRELYNLIRNFVVIGIDDKKDYNAYKELTPEKVMSEFRDIFIAPCLLSRSNNISSIRFSHWLGEYLFWISITSPHEIVIDISGNGASFSSGKITSSEASRPAYLQRHLSHLCEKGGIKFELETYQVGGLTCIGQLLDVFILMIMRSNILESTFLSGSGVLAVRLLMRRELVALKYGSMHKYHMSNQLLHSISQPIEARTQVSLLCILSFDSIVSVLRDPRNNTISELFREQLLIATPFWHQVSLFIGYENCPVSNNLSSLDHYLVTIVDSVVPCGSFFDISTYSFSCRDDESKEVHKFKMMNEVASIAAEMEYDFFVLLPERVLPFRLDGSHVFSQLERAQLNNRYGNDKLGLHSWNEISKSCAINFHTIASCAEEAIITLSSGHFELFERQLLPPSIRGDVLKMLQREHDGYLASNILVLCLIDIKKPFRSRGYSDAMPTLKEFAVKDLSPMIMPDTSYLIHIVESRKFVREAILNHGHSNFIDPSILHRVKSESPSSLSSYTSTNGVFYRYLCKVGNADTAKFCDYEGSLVSHQDSEPRSEARIAFVSAVNPHAEPSCPYVLPQSVPTDFILFFDVDEMASRVTACDQGLWKLDRTELKRLEPSHYLNNTLRQRLYIKANFHRIPRLWKYDIVVWLEPSIELHSEFVARDITNLFRKQADIALFEYSDEHSRVLAKSEREEFLQLYTQEYQDDLIKRSFQAELHRSVGYSSDHWQAMEPSRPLFGRWSTDFIAFNMRRRSVVASTLDVWHMQLLEFPPSSAEEDAMSLAMSIQLILLSNQLDLKVVSLPDSNHVNGSFRMNSLFFNSARFKWKFQ